MKRNSALLIKSVMYRPYSESVTFLIVEIVNSGKKIKFDVIDTWDVKHVVNSWIIKN